MSFGGGTVLSATKTHRTELANSRLRRSPSRAAAGTLSAFYALSAPGLADYWTCYTPYTAWHLSYVMLRGCAGADKPDPRSRARRAARLSVWPWASALYAVRSMLPAPAARHTHSPRQLLATLGATGLALAAALGIAGSTIVGPGVLALVGHRCPTRGGLRLRDRTVPFGPSASPWLGKRSRRRHRLCLGGLADLDWFGGSGRGGAQPGAAASVDARFARSAAARFSVTGQIRYRDGSTEPISGGRPYRCPEGALRLLWLAALINRRQRPRRTLAVAAASPASCAISRRSRCFLGQLPEEEQESMRPASEQQTTSRPSHSDTTTRVPLA